MEKRLKRYRMMLAELETLIRQEPIYYKGQALSGMPFGGGVGDPTGSRAFVHVVWEEQIFELKQEIRKERKELQRIFSEMEPEQARILKMRFFDGVPVLDVCEILDKPVWYILKKCEVCCNYMTEVL